MKDRFLLMGRSRLREILVAAVILNFALIIFSINMNFRFEHAEILVSEKCDLIQSKLFLTSRFILDPKEPPPDRTDLAKMISIAQTRIENTCNAYKNLTSSESRFQWAVLIELTFVNSGILYLMYKLFIYYALKSKLNGH